MTKLKVTIAAPDGSLATTEVSRATLSRVADLAEAEIKKIEGQGLDMTGKEKEAWFGNRSRELKDLTIAVDLSLGQ